MNVLEKIDRGDMRMRVYVGAGNIRNLNGENELLRLARLGAAAEKAAEEDTLGPCLPGKYKASSGCSYNHENECEWADFCRIRAEKGAG